MKISEMIRIHVKELEILKLYNIKIPRKNNHKIFKYVIY